MLAEHMGKVRDKKNRASGEAVATRFAHRRALAQVRQEAAEFAGSMRRGVDPAEAVQDILDEAHGAYQYATLQVLQLDESEYWVETMGIRVPNQWIREQERLMNLVLSIAGKAHSMGLAERMVRIDELQAEILSMAVERALTAKGLNFDDRREIHELIAQELDDIDTTGTDLPVLTSGKRAA